MMPRTLAQYARFIQSQPVTAFNVPVDVPVSRFQERSSDPNTPDGLVVTRVLDRRGQFQAEIVCILASEKGGTFGEHRHPNVNSIEWFLGGDLNFVVKNQPIQTECHGLLWVRSQDWHAVKVGPKGGMLISIQHWDKGVEPTSVGHNWEGPPHVECTPP
jgi:quercetin dioxygenase-like cupin family protein